MPIGIPGMGKSTLNTEIKAILQQVLTDYSYHEISSDEIR